MQEGLGSSAMLLGLVLPSVKRKRGWQPCNPSLTQSRAGPASVTAEPADGRKAPREPCTLQQQLTGIVEAHATTRGERKQRAWGRAWVV